MRLAAARACVGGLVVASPEEVAHAVERFAQSINDQTFADDQNGDQWGGALAERDGPLVGNSKGVPATLSSGYRTTIRVTYHHRSSLRHASNVSARWAAEMSGPVDGQAWASIAVARGL